MADTMKCAKCGSENPKDNKFCDSCGAKLMVPGDPAKKEAKADGKKAAAKTVKSSDMAITTQDLIQTPGAFTINWEAVIWLLIIIAAFVSRFAVLGDKPMHHDESMHAFYGWKLFMGNGYSYNPMLHGPFLFHANAFVYFLFGATDYTARIMPAFYGMLCILLLWYLKPQLGKTGAMVTAFIMAISPSFMYQSRYIRNDIYIAGDTIMIVVGLFKYFENKKPGWLFLAAVGLALSWATKEVTYITLFIFGTFFFVRWMWENSLKETDPDKYEEEGGMHRTVEYWLTKPGSKVFLTALGIFVAIHALLFFNKEPNHNFFVNAKGIIDGYIAALTYWLGQHGVARGSQPWYFYLLLTPFYELPSVFFGLIATVYYIIKKEKRTLFNIFCIYWWIMAMIIYSWAGEKMPWLVLHPLLPLMLIAGKMIADIIESKEQTWKRAAGLVMFVLLSLGSIHGAINVCFYEEGASPKESLIYVQSSVDSTKIVRNLDNFANRMKALKWDSQEFRRYSPYDLEMVIEDYCSWPFAWYLRDYKKIAYPPKMIPDSDVGKAIIFSGIEEANAGHDAAVKAKLENDYVAFRYKLREWWAPDEKKWWSAPLFSAPNKPGKIEMMWKRFMYRDVWNDLGSYDMVVYVRKDLEKYWLEGGDR